MRKGFKDLEMDRKLKVIQELLFFDSENNSLSLR